MCGIEADVLTLRVSLHPKHCRAIVAPIGVVILGSDLVLVGLGLAVVFRHELAKQKLAAAALVLAGLVLVVGTVVPRPHRERITTSGSGPQPSC